MVYIWETDKWFPAQRWLLRYSQLFMVYNLVSPMRSHYLGRNFARNDEGAEDIGESKKRTIVCNALYRGIKFALIRKDADLLYGVLLHERRHYL